jgi:hypothetical protein
MSIRPILPFLFLALLCASCEEVLEFDIDPGDRQLVVNALPCTDSTLFVNVTYSRFFIDNQPFPPADGATVSVDINGVPTSPTSHDGANWWFPYTAVAGDLLTVHVSLPGHDPVSGTTRVPALPNMQAPIAEIDTLQPINSGDILFTLSDPADQQNYYYIYVEEYDSGSRWNQWESRWDTIDTVIHSYFNCLDLQVTDPAVNSSLGLMGYFNGLLFTDSLINGQAHEMKISLMMFKDTAENPIQRHYTLVVQSLSHEAFRYIKDVQQSQSVTQFFAEPAQVYSNLDGGLGIFAAIAIRRYPLQFVFKQQEDPIPQNKNKNISKAKP